MKAKERRNRNVMWLAEQVLGIVSVFKGAIKNSMLILSFELDRLKILKQFAHVQKVLI
jgi:hypothetical protein